MLLFDNQHAGRRHRMLLQLSFLAILGSTIIAITKVSEVGSTGDLTHLHIII